MKVIILTCEPFPDGMAAARRIECYARALLSSGIESEVVVYMRGGKPDDQFVYSPRGSFKSVPYRYIGGSTTYSSHPFIRKIEFHYDLHATEIYLKRHLTKGDVLFMYIGRDPHIMLRFMKVAHDEGAFCVRDLGEIPFGTGSETAEAVRLREKVLSEQFPRLDGVVSISDELMALAKEFTEPSCKHIKVPIMVDFNEFNIPDRSREQEIPYVFHSGTMYEQKDGILGMIEAFGMAQDSLDTSVRFIMTGSPERSPHCDEIIKLIEKYNLEDKILFKGYLPDDELRACLSGASLTIINKYTTQQNRYCFSTKLGEYLSAGKPVIITRVGEAMNWVRDGESAYVVEPGDTKALADAIVRAFNDPCERQAISSKARIVARTCFDYALWGKPLSVFMGSLGK